MSGDVIAPGRRLVATMMLRGRRLLSSAQGHKGPGRHCISHCGSSSTGTDRA